MTKYKVKIHEGKPITAPMDIFEDFTEGKIEKSQFGKGSPIYYVQTEAENPAWATLQAEEYLQEYINERQR